MSETMRFRALGSMVPSSESTYPILARFSATARRGDGTSATVRRKAESREEKILHDFLNGVLR
ncbi:hypothetical protein [Microbacterium sp. NC79]|uniref:hypothetical protein n=1 Tax=Microbacterium sp. NC79 TaxID=2851009 RepID=UPI001C2B9057|nr:hypothetical protein [Microbacterium sp. NC79]MBV0894908.1 hypothetical protein [Microbacterium sp. NC79]